jgi:hypothetical protein
MKTSLYYDCFERVIATQSTKKTASATSHHHPLHFVAARTAFQSWSWHSGTAILHVTLSLSLSLLSLLSPSFRGARSERKCIQSVESKKDIQRN